jgi:site-specific DNA-methyltransferase (adenine-specific)
MNTNKPLNITGYKDKHVYQSTGGITSTVYLMDCMDFLQQVPEKYFDLAVVDPPYGIGVNHSMGRRKGDKKSEYKKADWDFQPPTKKYFDQLFHGCINAIIWGANHFISRMPKDSACWLMWDKKFSEDVSFAQFELAYTSLNGTCKKFDMHPFQKDRFHPTQKPVPLYDWIYQNYAKPGQVILDTHLGSGSNRIAAHKNNLEFVGVELDPEYFYASVKRFDQYTSQLTLF